MHYNFQYIQYSCLIRVTIAIGLKMEVDENGSNPNVGFSEPVSWSSGAHHIMCNKFNQRMLIVTSRSATCSQYCNKNNQQICVHMTNANQLNLMIAILSNR